LHPVEGESRLLLADLHLGLGATPGQSQGPPGASAQEMAASLTLAARDARAMGIVVLGDVKHPIVGTPRPLRPVVFDFFSTLLSAGLAVDIVLGNHDVGLTRYLPKEVRVHGASGYVLDGVGLFHGHRWPSSAVLASPTLAVGHLHPGIRLAPSADTPRGKERCWVRVTFPEPAPGPARRRARPLPSAREMIVLPAFNPLAGTESLNRGRPRLSRSFLFHRFVARGSARAYLLDGTDLGPIPTGRSAEPPEEPRRSPSAR
jgi:metallophosphoesterase superfamily enzyme